MIDCEKGVKIMGTFYTKCFIENHMDRKKSIVVPKLLVDTGSEYTWIPENLLEKIAAFCSIASPDSFLNLLKSLGANPVGIKAFLDHHLYSEEDVLSLLDMCREKNIQTLVTTQKDAVKLKGFLNFLIYMGLSGDFPALYGLNVNYLVFDALILFPADF